MGICPSRLRRAGITGQPRSGCPGTDRAASDFLRASLQARNVRGQLQTEVLESDHQCAPEDGSNLEFLQPCLLTAILFRVLMPQTMEIGLDA